MRSTVVPSRAALRCTHGKRSSTGSLPRAPERRSGSRALPLFDDSGALGRRRQTAARFSFWVEGAVTRSLWTAAGNESAPGKGEARPGCAARAQEQKRRPVRYPAVAGQCFSGAWSGMPGYARWRYISGIATPKRAFNRRTSWWSAGVGSKLPVLHRIWSSGVMHRAGRPAMRPSPRRPSAEIRISNPLHSSCDRRRCPPRRSAPRAHRPAGRRIGLKRIFLSVVPGGSPPRGG